MPSARPVKRLELSVAADADLFDILAYGTAVHGEAASDAYYLGLCEALKLEEFMAFQISK